MESTGAPSKHAQDNLNSWGHEFVRSLAGEIGQEYNQRILELGADPESDEPFADLIKMVHVIVPFHLTHNAEAEAVDLLIEVQRLKFLLELDGIDENNYQRICLYLMKTASYMSDPDDLQVSSPGGWIPYPTGEDSASLTRISPHDRKCTRQPMKSSRSKSNTLMP